jgi:hypothetical protein
MKDARDYRHSQERSPAFLRFGSSEIAVRVP